MNAIEWDSNSIFSPSQTRQCKSGDTGNVTNFHNGSLQSLGSAYLFLFCIFFHPNPWKHLEWLPPPPPPQKKKIERKTDRFPALFRPRLFVGSAHMCRNTRASTLCGRLFARPGTSSVNTTSDHRPGSALTNQLFIGRNSRFFCVT